MKQRRIEVERNDSRLVVKIGKRIGPMQLGVILSLEPDEIELDHRAARELAEFLLRNIEAK